MHVPTHGFLTENEALAPIGEVRAVENVTHFQDATTCIPKQCAHNNKGQDLTQPHTPYGWVEGDQPHVSRRGSTNEVVKMVGE